MIYVLALAICAFAYRLRGGGFITFGGDTAPRLIWAGFFTVTAFALVPFHTLFQYCLAAGLCTLGKIYSSSTILIFSEFFPLAFLMVVLIPHVFVQQMGHEPLPFTTTKLSKWWPAYYEAWLTTSDWNAMSAVEKFTLDFFSMTVVGLLRGIFMFAPVAITEYLCGFTAYGNYMIPTIVLVPAVVKAFGQSIAYTLGVYVIPGKWQPGSWDFSELLDGASWAIALILFIRLLYA